MGASLAPELAAWRDRGSFRRVFGHDVFVLTSGPADAEPVLLLHGFPTSSFDFRHALPLLGERRPVVVHDHVGFGLSDKPERWSYSLLEQAEIAAEVWRGLGITRGHVVAHDYGTSVATELLARRERGLLGIDIRSVTLCNGSVHIELADLTASQRLLRNRWLGPVFAKVATRRVFKAQLRRTLGVPSAVSDAELDLLWAGMVHGGGLARLPQLSSYIEERTRFWERWIGALTRLDTPAYVVWGRRDPVAVPAIAERLASEIPGARLTWLDDLGHYPMLEAPERWADAVRAGIDAADAVTARWSIPITQAPRTSRPRGR